MTRRIAPVVNIRSRSLRKSMTEAEALLWWAIRRRCIGCRFRRRHPVGGFYVDFACLRHRPAVELDGEKHFESEHDAVRDARLHARGFTVLRFWNTEILADLDTVLDTVDAHCRMASWE